MSLTLAHSLAEVLSSLLSSVVSCPFVSLSVSPVIVRVRIVQLYDEVERREMSPFRMEWVNIHSEI